MRMVGLRIIWGGGVVLGLGLDDVKSHSLVRFTVHEFLLASKSIANFLYTDDPHPPTPNPKYFWMGWGDWRSGEDIS